MKKILAAACFVLFAAGCSDTHPKFEEEKKLNYSDGSIVGSSVRDPVTGSIDPTGKGKWVPIASYNGLSKSPADTTETKKLRFLIDAQRQELAARAETRDDLQAVVNAQTPKDIELDPTKSERLFIGTRHGIPE